MIKTIASKLFQEVLPKTLTSSTKKCTTKVSKTTKFVLRQSSPAKIPTPSLTTCPLDVKSSCTCTCNANKKDSKLQYAKKDEEYILALMFFAIQYKNTEQLKELCESLRMNLNVLNEDGISPLHFAAIVCTPECVEILREYGACYNMLDERGQKPVYYANMMEDDATIKALTN